MRRNRSAKAEVSDLPPDMLANIHGRLSLLDRLAFAAVFRASRDAFRPDGPCLVLPGDTPETATLFSLSDRRTAVVRAPGPDHVVLGPSSRGWLVTADDRARLHLVNPVTGEQRTLPAITTHPLPLRAMGASSFLIVDQKYFVRGPPYPGGGRPDRLGTYTIGAELMRRFFYRKVVLSDSSRPAAMLIIGPRFGVPAVTCLTSRWI